MNWQPLHSPEQLKNIIEESHQKTVLIFKHSTTCSISVASLGRLERNWASDQISTYYLDLKSFRETSDAVAKVLGVTHESPQAIVLKNAEVVYTESHFDINAVEIQALA